MGCELCGKPRETTPINIDIDGFEGEVQVCKYCKEYVTELLSKDVTELAGVH